MLVAGRNWGTVRITDLPTFDEFVEQLLTKFFGPGATIVALWLALSWLLSWKQGLGYGVSIFRASKGVANAALALRPVSFAVALGSSAVMLAVQAIWIWTCYVAGNAWSYLINPPGYIPDDGPDWAYIFGSLHWDTISKVYVGACILALIGCYAEAIGHGESPISVVLRAPILLLAVPNVLATVIALVVSGFGLAFALLQRLVEGHFQPMYPVVKGTLLILGLGLTHIVTTLMSLNSPAKMSNAWTRKSPGTTLEGLKWR
jgi:hypothetical protein